MMEESAMSSIPEKKLLEHLSVRMQILGGVVLSVIQDDPPIDWKLFQHFLEVDGRLKLVRMDFGDSTPDFGFATEKLLSAYGIGPQHTEMHPALRFRQVLLDAALFRGRTPVLLMEGLAALDKPVGDDFLAALHSALTAAGDQAHAIFVCRDAEIRRRLFHRRGRAMTDVAFDFDIA